MYILCFIIYYNIVIQYIIYINYSKSKTIVKQRRFYAIIHIRRLIL